VNLTSADTSPRIVPGAVTVDASEAKALHGTVRGNWLELEVGAP
jgi:hypothetical protein